MESLRYDGAPLGAWSLFLFGDVPGHQLDWIWRPSPSGPGPTPQHVQHLLALVRGFDAPDPSDSALTIGNLSLGDSRHQPGRGALAILLHFRLPASRDHSGRPNPPLVVALVATDGLLSGEQIEGAARALLSWAEGDREAGERPVDAWYQDYVLAAAQGPEVASACCARFMGGLVDLPDPGAPAAECSWRLPDGAQLPGLIELCADVPRAVALHHMAGLAAELRRSRARWSALSTTTPAQHSADQGLIIALAPAGPTDRVTRRVSRMPEAAEGWARDLLGLISMAEDSAPIELGGPLPAPTPPLVPPLPVPPPPVPPPPVPPPQDPPPATNPQPRPLSPSPSPRPGVVAPSNRWMLWSAVGGLCALGLLLALLRSCQTPEPAARTTPTTTPAEPSPVTTPAEPTPVAPTEVTPTEVAPTAAAPTAAATTPVAPRPTPRRAPPAPAATVSAAAGVDCGLVPDRSDLAPTPIRGEARLAPGLYTLSCRLDGDTWEEQRSVTLLDGSSWTIRCVGGQCALRPR